MYPREVPEKSPPSSEMVALRWDNEPDLDSRILISPCFSCGPFTLHNPTCFQVTGPESYPLPPLPHLEVRLTPTGRVEVGSA